LTLKGKKKFVVSLIIILLMILAFWVNFKTTAKMQNIPQTVIPKITLNYYFTSKQVFAF